MKAGYESTPVSDEPHVFTPLSKPLHRAKVALMTSAGVFLKDSQPSFDIEREKREPTWGDPTYRVIPSDVTQEQIDAAHLHINTDDIVEDVNVVLPFRAFRKLAQEGTIGALADDNYSFMGFQERGAKSWQTTEGPELGARLKEQSVDVLLLAPA